MKKPTHTPGPWTVVKKQGWLIGPNLKPLPRGEIQHTGFMVAHVPELSARREEQKANAQLIAAAPEILAMLETLCISISERVDIEQLLYTVEAAQELIKKIREV